MRKLRAADDTAARGVSLRNSLMNVLLMPLMHERPRGVNAIMIASRRDSMIMSANSGKSKRPSSGRFAATSATCTLDA